MPALAAGVMLLCAALAALFGLWLFTIGIALGVVVRVGMLANHVLRELPRRLAHHAASAPWREPGDGYEQRIESELRTMAAGWVRALNRAERHVIKMTDDPADRYVALERLSMARAGCSTRRVPRLRPRVLLANARSTAFAVVAGGVTLFLLGESTPGPVLEYPWRAWTGIGAAGVVGAVYGRAHGKSP